MMVLASIALCSPAKAMNEDVSCLALNIYHEARNQPMVGQIAVALVTLNRVDDPRFPNTVCGVVTQGKHVGGVPVKNKCHFSWYCDGKSDKALNIELYQGIVQLAKTIYRNRDSIYDITNGSTHYHTDKVHPYWVETKERVVQIEDHIFYRWE